MRFSERYGYKPIRQIVQIESMDALLKTDIWNVLYNQCLKPFADYSWSSEARKLYNALWQDFFRIGIDQSPAAPHMALEVIRKRYADFAWNEVYDFIEFFLQYVYNNSFLLQVLSSALNTVLDREMAAYRVVDKLIVPNLSEPAIAAIERAERLGGRFAPASEHIRSALQMLSDRNSPDFRNSIKESVSAVEAVCRLVTSKATLGEALRSLPQSGIIVHPAVREAFSKLYGFTSDAEGIRHALMENSTVDQQDALYMLVVCAAFVDLIQSRATP